MTPRERHIDESQAVWSETSTHVPRVRVVAPNGDDIQYEGLLLLRGCDADWREKNCHEQH
jgi:hypothetical protein